MDVRDLQVFLSVSKHLNYTRAGEELNLSQPSVSVRIRQLETQLSVKLFEQLGKKVALTDAGQLLVPYARRVLTAVEDAHHGRFFRMRFSIESRPDQSALGGAL